MANQPSELTKALKEHTLIAPPPSPEIIRKICSKCGKLNANWDETYGCVWCRLDKIDVDCESIKRDIRASNESMGSSIEELKKSIDRMKKSFCALHSEPIPIPKK
jgi:hypothetical protein